MAGYSPYPHVNPEEGSSESCRGPGLLAFASPSSVSFMVRLRGLLFHLLAWHPTHVVGRNGKKVRARPAYICKVRGSHAAESQAAWPSVLLSHQNWSSPGNGQESGSCEGYGGSREAQGMSTTHCFLPIIQQTCARMANLLLRWPRRNRLGKRIFSVFPAAFLSHWLGWKWSSCIWFLSIARKTLKLSSAMCSIIVLFDFPARTQVFTFHAGAKAFQCCCSDRLQNRGPF